MKDTTAHTAHADRLDLLVVGGGPTGIAIGAEAVRNDLSVLLVDRGPMLAAIQQYPTDLTFFSTRDLLEIADVPFAIPEAKPTRRQVIAYYRGVLERYRIPLAQHEEVVAVQPPEAGSGEDGWFTVDSVHRGVSRRRRARAVVLATGYFGNPTRLGVPGEELPWVSNRYVDADRHYGQHVLVVGAGNTAAEAALDMWRHGVRVTLVVRGGEVKGSVKYWLKPDLENRIAEGSIPAHWHTVVTAFREEGDRRLVDVAPAGEGVPAPGGGEGGKATLPVDHAYVFIGYAPDVTLQRRAGVRVDPDTLVPEHDPETCETNVPGLYLAGTILAGEKTDQIFIENSRDHAPKIVHHLVERLKRQPVAG